MPERKAMTRIIRSLRSGQITIPAEFRKKLGITDESVLLVTLEREELRIRPIAVAETGRGSPWLKELYDYFVPVRKEAEEQGYTDEEINATIDAAVKAVREPHG